MAIENWMKKLSKAQYVIKDERDVKVPMRDGVKLAVNIFRPDADGEFPALLSMSPYGKEIQTLPEPEAPYHWFHGSAGVEAGDTKFWVSRGYAHVIADVRGSGTSEGEFVNAGKKEQEDGYDLVEWIAEQPWCNGNVGMIGMSYFAVIQLLVAGQQPPHLKALFVCEGSTDLYRQLAYHGGILDIGFFIIWNPLLSVHTYEMTSRKILPSEDLSQWIEYWKKNRDLQFHPGCYGTLICPERNPPLFDLLMHPYDAPYYWERSPYTVFEKIHVPVYLLSRWNGWSIHLPGAFSAYTGIKAPKKLKIFNTPDLRGPARPWRENHDVALRWYDYWLKGIDTGIMDEPPIEILVRGVDKVRHEHEWPLARTKWAKFYLRDGGRLTKDPPTESESFNTFINNTYWQFGEVPCLKYTTAQFESNVEVTGPIVLYMHAAINSPDANWMIVMKDIGPDDSEEIVTKGWLKASHREIDEKRSTPYKPYHPHRKSVPVEPGRIYEYAIEIRETSYVFKRGHALQLIIKGEDTPYEDVASVSYYHLPKAEKTEHSIYHDKNYRSHLMLPIV
jgi:hypothetical protein